MAPRNKAAKRRVQAAPPSRSRSKVMKGKTLASKTGVAKTPIEKPDVATQQQLKQYEEALRLLQQQKFHKAMLLLEAVVKGPSKELADRAGMHIGVGAQAIPRPPRPGVRPAV